MRNPTAERGIAGSVERFHLRELPEAEVVWSRRAGVIARHNVVRERRRVRLVGVAREWRSTFKVTK